MGKPKQKSKGGSKLAAKKIQAARSARRAGGKTKVSKRVQKRRQEEGQWFDAYEAEKKSAAAQSKPVDAQANKLSTTPQAGGGAVSSGAAKSKGQKTQKG